MSAKSSAQHVKFQCPANINLRYWLFALATKADQWRDNSAFSFWIGEQIKALEVAHPFAAHQGHVFDQATFDQFLTSVVPQPKPAAVARALAYFNSMPCRQTKEHHESTSQTDHAVLSK